MSKASFLVTRGLGSPEGLSYLLTGGLGDYAATFPVEPVGPVYPIVMIQHALDPDSPTAFTRIYDVRGDEPVICEYGIAGDSATDRIASAGVLSYALDNSAHNAAHTVGLYSVNHASKLAGFDLNNPVKLVLTCPDIDGLVGGVVEYVKFRGRLDAAPADPGAYGPRLVHCTAVDLMNDWANTTEPDLDVQLNQRSDELLYTILAALPVDLQPAAKQFDRGIETYPIALDGGTGQQLSIRDRLNQIALSEFGKIFLKGDLVQGGTLAFYNRRHNTVDPTVLFTFEDDMSAEGGIEVETSRSHIFRSVQVNVYPTNDVDITPAAVIYELTAPLYVGPYQTITPFGPFRDPETNDIIGGTAFLPVISGTDYDWNSESDGTGAGLNAYFSVTNTTTGSGVDWTITNSGAVGGWSTLQLRGTPIKRSKLVVNVTVQGGYGNQVFTYDMPYQDSPNVGSTIASYLAQLLASLRAQITSVRFLANKSAYYMRAALKREPGDRIKISESVTGISDAEVVINRVRYEFVNGLMWVTWFVEAISAQRYWLLGVPGASTLGDTTVLGI